MASATLASHPVALPKTLQRTTFTTSRALEFFSEKELAIQMGFASDYWPIALTKELLDNASMPARPPAWPRS